jgi:putative hemolysin
LTNTETGIQPIQIDVAKLIASKNQTLARWLPGFVLRWLKRTIHEDEINQGLRESKDLHDLDFAAWTLRYLQATTTASGQANIPAQGGVIIAANHPLGGLDGLAFMHEAGKVRPDIRFVINDLLMNLPNFPKIGIGVNKHGTNARAALAAIDEAYASGGAMLIFPAGLCSRKQNGLIRDLEWQKSFVARAQKYQLPVVPTFIRGANSNWFYNLANWRKRLGLKANLEMLYLPDEMFRQRGQNINLTFGPLIPAQTFDQRYRPQEWAELLRRFVYVLDKQPNADFENFIATQRDSALTVTN